MDNGSNKQKIIAQVVCILISIGLWVYITNIENPIRTYDLSRVPVKLINEDSLKESNLTLSPNREYYVTLKLEGQSQEIFNVERKDFEIEVDLSEYALNVGQKKIQVNIVDSPKNITIKNSSALAIDLEIEELVEKQVPVKSMIEVITKSSYYVGTPKFSPNVVTVTGAASIIDSVEYVMAEGQEENVEKTIVKNYIITAVDKDYNKVNFVELSQGWIEATININKGKYVNVVVNTIGELSKDYKIIGMIPDIDTVELTGPEEILNSISEIYTESIDLSKITDTADIVTNLIIPEGVINSSQNAINVSIKVEKTKTKEFNIIPSIIGIQDNVTMTTSNNNIKVIIKGYEEQLSKLKDENIKAVLDVSKFTEEGSYSESPVVTIEGIELDIEIESTSNIEFTINKNQDEIVPEEDTETATNLDSILE